MSQVILDELHIEGVATHSGQGVNAIEAAGGDEARLRVLCDDQILEADMGSNADHRQPAAEKALIET